jgi:2-keto-4-pentenoate hydratase/2-oxohepta-3-ene-1,7-dioic acid hydratase in catechol pathway
VKHQGFSVQWVDGKAYDHALGKIVCVGRNYLAHIHELGNEIPDEPLLFMKPETAAVQFAEPFSIPSGDVHFETELAILIGQTLTRATPEQCRAAVAGIGLALDLTRRDLQNELKQKSLPWEVAKAFDGACPLTPFMPVLPSDDLTSLTFKMWLNGTLTQEGHANLMRHSVVQLLTCIATHFTLKPGDVVLTGTPAGVGRLHAGDRIRLLLNNQHEFSSHVV